MTLTDLIKDTKTYNKVWRVAVASYPYHTAQELGVSDWTYAYQATKMAIYCVTGQANVSDYYADDDIGKSIVNLIKKLVNIGENGTETYKTPLSNINEVGNISLNDNYYVQKYNLTSNLNILTYTIAITNFPKGTIVTDTKGNIKETFNAGSEFQIKIPKSEFEKQDINGKIRGTIQTKEYALFYGNSYNPATQDYAVTADPISLNSCSKTLNIKNNNAKIKIYKFNDDQSSPIAGVTFELYKDGKVIQTSKTDDNGIAMFDNLYAGTYYVKEKNTVNGYLLNNTNMEITVPYNTITEKKVINSEPTGSISIIKRDSQTGSVPQGDATLEDAVYKVYANEDIYNVAKTKKFYSKGDFIATCTTNEKGIATKADNLPLGHYIVKEETASKGYLLDTKVYNVHLKYKDQHTKIITQSVTSNEDVKEQQIHIYKSGIKVQSGLVAGLEGAEFTIKLYSDVQKALKEGYSYEEIWNGIDEYGNSVTVDNKRVAKAQVIAPSYQKVVTDENGNAYTKKLPFGKYITKETKTPKDFYSAQDFTFTISKDESEISEVAQKVKHLLVNNEQMETYIKLVKKDSNSGKIVSLTSATFQIKATKDIYDRGNGKIVYKKGEIITQKIGSTVYNSFTTNSKNIVVPNESYTNNKDDKGTVITPLMLPTGSYEISEIQIPTGYLQLEKPITFTVDGVRDYDKDKEGDYIKEVILKNAKPSGTLIIDKSIALRKNVDTSLVDISDLSKIQFKFSAKDDVIDPSDGSIIYKRNQEIKVYNLDKKGNLKIENIPMGTYEIQEIKTLDGLVLNDTKYEVKFTQKDQVKKVYTENRNIINDTTITEISKQDITGNKELTGAKLQIIDPSNNKIIDEWISIDKPHSIEGLTVGKEYILRETISPKEYVKATDIKFKVENTKDTNKVKMIDKIVEMTKVNIGGEELEGAKMQVFDKENNLVDEWISSKEPHKINDLVENETYKLHEEVAIEGYVKATDIEFTVTEDKETQKIQMIDKVVEMTKVNIDGEELEGAKMQVFDKENNLVDEWVSSKEPHKINNLVENETYKLHEEIAIEGYVKATDVEFTVTEEKETQKLQMIDKIVKVTKTDLINGKELEGAELVVIDADRNIIDEWSSTKEPHHISGLEEGKTYTLAEKKAPYSYKTTDSITFTVTEDKETQTIEMKDMPILKTIRIIKADSSTKEVIKSNFKFGIYEDAECTKLIEEVKSNKNDGTVTFGDLRFGTYFIKESKQPHGYQLSDKVLKLEINDKGVFIDNVEIEEKDNIYSFTFYNDLIPKIQTGNEISHILLTTLMGLSLIGITTGIVVLKRKDRKNK